MKDALYCFAGESVPAARALAEGAGLAASLADDGPRISLYAAGLSGETIALGAWQRRVSARVPPAADVVRRRTGGVACQAGDGIVYVALGLRTASELMACPRDRVLNRNVRGLLRGLSAHYFGRDVVSLVHRPVALVAWDRDADGRVLVEAFIGRTRTIEVDGGRERAKKCITLAEAWGREPSAHEITRLIVERGFELETREVVPPNSPLVDRDENDFQWSDPVEIPIGMVEAGLRVDRQIIADARLAGDFMQDRDAPERLAARLIGRRPERTIFAGALNATYGASGDAVIEGVRSLESLLDAFVDAAR